MGNTHVYEHIILQLQSSMPTLTKANLAKLYHNVNYRFFQSRAILASIPISFNQGIHMRLKQFQLEY